MPIKTHERAMIASQITDQINNYNICIRIDNWETNIIVNRNAKIPVIETALTGKLKGRVIDYVTGTDWSGVRRVIKYTKCVKFFHPSILEKIEYKAKRRNK